MSPRPLYDAMAAPPALERLQEALRDARCALVEVRDNPRVAGTALYASVQQAIANTDEALRLAARLRR